MRPVNCMIYGGLSSLVAPFLLGAPQHFTFTLLIRDEWSKPREEYREALVSIRSSTRVYAFHNKNLLEIAKTAMETHHINVVLVFTTHPDPAFMDYLQTQNVHTLYIGSGAVTDAMSGRGAWNEYTLGKHWPERFATLTLRCGFFIPDIGAAIRCAPPAGLHTESAKKIWADQCDVDSAWLSKSMYVTPVSFLITIIWVWCSTDKEECLQGVYHCGTKHSLSRGFLRSCAGLKMPDDYVEKVLEPIYQAQWEHSLANKLLCPDSVNDIPGACQRAAAKYH